MATLASAQERFGGLAGRVTDPQGAAVPEAAVIVQNLETDAVRTFVTDARGEYLAVDLPPGRYTVRVERQGFAPVERADINVILGRTFRLDTGLPLGAVTESVQVVGDAAPLIDLRTTVVAHNVTSDEIDRMPKGRSYQSVAMTAPSVTSGVIEGGYQVNGASGAENLFTVDGVVTNSLINGQSRQDTVFEYLQEVQVKTVGIPAEYGGALGGVISAVTRSGGNTFRGEGHYYYMGSGLGAGPPRRLVLSPTDDVSVSYVQDGKMPDHRNEIGGSLGGPLVRDRLFFFGSLSPRFVQRTHTYGFSNGAQTGTITQERTTVNAYGKVSYAGRGVNAYVGTLWTPTDVTGTLPAFVGDGPNTITSTLESNRPNAERGFEIDQRDVSANADIVLNGSNLLTVKTGWFYDDYRDRGVPLTTAVVYRTSSLGLPGVPPEYQGGVFFQNTPSVQIVDHDTTQQSYVDADLLTSFRAGGEHLLKIGGGLRHTSNDVDQRYPGGVVQVFWDRTFTSSVPGVGSGRGAFGYYEVNDLGTVGSASANLAHLYVQDQWSLGNLTLNLGVRFEQETVPSFRPAIKENAFEFGFGDMVSPRIGVAYDLRGDGRTKIFGAYGRYHDWTKYDVARSYFGADVWTVAYRGLDDPTEVFALGLDYMPGQDLWGSASGVRDLRSPDFDTVDPTMKPMAQDSFNVGVERQVGRRAVLTVNYVHTNLVRALEDIALLVDGSPIYLFANPGEGLGTDAFVSTATPPFTVPKGKRQYDALQVSLNRRFDDGWFFGGSYVWSRLYGNYAGLANADELHTPTEGVAWSADQMQGGTLARLGSNANRNWDLDENMWDAHGNLDPRGPLPTDRPHVLKLYGSYMTPFGTQVGLNLFAGSGTPLTTYLNTLNQLQAFVNGRGDMGRTPVLSYTDLLLAHEFRVPTSGQRFRVELNLLNLFNQKTARHRFNHLNRPLRASTAVNLAPANLAQGYDYDALIAATSDGADAYDPRYGLEDLFSDGTSGHLLVKWLF
jgi:hypothetical protein